MNQLKNIITVSLLFFAAESLSAQNRDQRNSSVLGVFQASTPCSEGTRPLPGIPVNAECRLIKWKLTLYQDALSKTPTFYKLDCLYGLPDQGTNGLIGGGKKIAFEGRWTIAQNTASNSGATIYHLLIDGTSRPISLLKLSDHVLHLLDSDLHLMIGSAAWSYTLNRVSNK